jgi:hypothetical protein
MTFWTFREGPKRIWVFQANMAASLSTDLLLPIQWQPLSPLFDLSANSRFSSPYSPLHRPFAQPAQSSVGEHIPIPHPNPMVNGKADG